MPYVPAFHGVQIGEDHTKGLKAIERAKASCDLHFYLGHSRGSFGNIVAKGGTLVSQKAQDIIAILLRPRQQIERFVLCGSATRSIFANMIFLVCLKPFSQDGGKSVQIPCNTGFGCGGFFRLHMRLQQQLAHLPHPRLLHLLFNKAQFTQVMGVA